MISITKKQANRWMTLLLILVLLAIAVVVYLLIRVAGNADLVTRGG